MEYGIVSMSIVTYRNIELLPLTFVLEQIANEEVVSNSLTEWMNEFLRQVQYLRDTNDIMYDYYPYVTNMVINDCLVGITTISDITVDVAKSLLLIINDKFFNDGNSEY
jgi:hypothetical protein